jgi:hypothetical protein
MRWRRSHHRPATRLLPLDLARHRFPISTSRWPAGSLVRAPMLAAVPAFVRSEAELRAAQQAAIHRLDLQLALPAGEDGGWSLHLNLPPEFLLLALLLGLAVIAYQFKDALPIWRWRRSEHADEAAPGAAMVDSPARAAALAADELARQGRFVDAMHLLLLQGLAAIREKLDEPFADSLTSREILRGTRLSEAGKALLRDLVMRVEWTYFGQHPAGRGDYDACRVCFDQLARVLQAGRAA